MCGEEVDAVGAHLGKGLAQALLEAIDAGTVGSTKGLDLIKVPITGADILEGHGATAALDIGLVPSLSCSLSGTAAEARVEYGVLILDYLQSVEGGNELSDGGNSGADLDGRGLFREHAATGQEVLLGKVVRFISGDEVGVWVWDGTSSDIGDEEEKGEKR